MNETPIDLQYVDGQRFEAAQRRITGPEIIDGYGNAEISQLAEHVSTMVVGDHECAGVTQARRRGRIRHPAWHLERWHRGTEEVRVIEGRMFKDGRSSR